MMEHAELKAIVEAMIFVSEDPITETGLVIALENGGAEKADIKSCLAEIAARWNENPECGLQLAVVAGGYQFRTKEKCADWLKTLNVPKPMRLSSPSLETLAIVAYKQPIVRSEIEKIRGVDSGGVLKTLLERRLLRIVGRRDEPGQPLLYGTTKDFLEIFNLRTLKELPTLKDVEELLREHRTRTESAAEVPVAISEDGEERSKVLEDVDDEEETEIIPRYPLDEDEEVESKDMEALDDLECSLKSLRRLEKNIFPKPLPELGGIDVQSSIIEGASAQAGSAEEYELEDRAEPGCENEAFQENAAEYTSAADEAAGEVKAQSVDSPID